MVKLSQKRRGHPGPSAPAATKKRKLDANPDAPARKVRTVPKKEKAARQKTIPIPSAAQDGSAESEVDDEDVAFFENGAGSAAFLNKLDRTGIARSKHETVRLHKLNKTIRPKRAKDDDLPSVDSHTEDEGLWDSDIEGYSSAELPDSDAEEDLDDGSDSGDSSSSSSSSEDIEAKYERKAKKIVPKEDLRGAERLPVKLSDGQIQKRGYLPAAAEISEESDDDDLEEATRAMSELQPPAREDISTGARFGRPAVTSVIGAKSRKARIQGAKEQIASICQEIVADPENNLGLLRRLHSFSLPSITTATNPKPVHNDPVIRKLAFLSQLAVFKDVIPGYRIRPLTDKEKEEKVSQMVQRTRDYEQGLVGVYQGYLMVLEQEVKAKSELAETALACLCSLLEELTHFNFRLNIMSSLVSQLSRRSWNETTERCLKTLSTVMDKDQTGEASLELVRLLNRMIKERRFNVNAKALDCLLHLRLKSELGVKASDTRVDRDSDGMRQKDRRRKADKKYDPKAPHMSKKAKKAEKERKEIELEMREAEVDVDHEERSKTHTETLKLLFVLYFRILKSPKITPLLPGALVGISKFAHLVNVDFFKDLLATLRTLILRDVDEGDDDEDVDEDAPTPVNDLAETRHRLMCIVTAFELLSGQGEALTIDLADFVNFLYAILIDLSLVSDMKSSPSSQNPTSSAKSFPARRPGVQSSLADLLFRALSLVFNSRSSGAQDNPSWRSAAFAKRLMLSSLAWPPNTACRALEFVRTLLTRDSSLEVLLGTEKEERVVSGVYRPDVLDPQLSGALNAANFWELRLLTQTHWDAGVRAEAKALLHWKP